MQQRNSSAFIWVGDAIYADDFFPQQYPFQKKRVREATPTVLKDLYGRLLNDPGYQALTAPHNFTVLGVFDDHDYGTNNGDKYYKYKTESAMLYIDFLKQSSRNKPDLSIMEQRAMQGKGVYGVKVFDFRRPRGQELLSDQEAALEPDTRQNEKSSRVLSDRSVAIFLIDCRSNKTPWAKDFPSKYFLDYQADFLGEEQWAWFESTLSRSTASVNVIVQGLQVHADTMFDGNIVEDWSRFPMAQHRLYQTVLKSGAAAPVFVSGDVHMAQLLRRDCRRVKSGTSSQSETTRTLLELTTSGMTHSWGTNICARPHTGLSCRNPLMQKGLKLGMHWAHFTPAWTHVIDLLDEPYEPGAKRRVQYVLERNFGEFEFDWKRRQLIVRIFGMNADRGPILSTAFDFDALSGKSSLPQTTLASQALFQKTYERLAPYGARDDDWICVSYRGQPSLALKVFNVVTPIILASLITLSPLILLAFLVYLSRRSSGKFKKKPE
jgi:hypothetical protein